MAMRLGFAKFLIPFIFVYYPGIVFSEYFVLSEMILVFPRIILMIWLISSSLAMFDNIKLTLLESLFRFGIAIGLLLTYLFIGLVLF